MDAIGLALLHRAIDDLQELGTYAFNGTPTGSHRYKRRRLASQDCVWATVDTIHEVLNRR